MTWLDRREDLRPQRIASHGDEEVGIASTSDDRHGIVIELIHIPRAADEGRGQDDSLADVSWIYAIGQGVEDILIAVGSEDGLVTSDPVEPTLFYLTVGIDTELLKQEATV